MRRPSAAAIASRKRPELGARESDLTTADDPPRPEPAPASVIPLHERRVDLRVAAATAFPESDRPLTYATLYR